MGKQMDAKQLLAAMAFFVGVISIAISVIVSELRGLRKAVDRLHETINLANRNGNRENDEATIEAIQAKRR
jgi:hypothetical protein